MPEIENHLGQVRSQRGVAAAQLAKSAGVSRQTIYAIEAGTYVPNTALALKLARLLDTKVEDLFALADAAQPSALRTEAVTMLPGSDHLAPGQPVQLCRVDRRLIASAPSAVRWYLPASDAIVAAQDKVQVFHSDDEFRGRLLVAGCDPAISVLARHVQAAGVELVLAHRNSSQALELLKDGFVHIAGTHLRDETSGESNLPEIGRMFPKKSVAVITFAVWEEGIVTARGNPKSIQGIEDFARPDVAIVNREPGAGARRLLDDRLHRAGISAAKIRGYTEEAPGHLPAAWHVMTAAADCCIATRAAARVFGLGFLPLVTERYDLAIRNKDLDLPATQSLLDILSRSAFRREVESLGGYDTSTTGDRML
jgi:molybdate-binding protein/DNA-binding XRE family transcriptional regulator